LTSLLFVSLTVFSQTDTTSNIKCFPIPVVKQIMKDVISGDLARAQLKLTEEQLILIEKKLVLKDSIINTLRLKEDNYQNTIVSEKQKYEIINDYSKKLELDLKKEKVKGRFKSLIGSAVIIVLGYLLTTK